MPRRRKIGARDVLLEFHRVGNAVRVVAIDQPSGTEVILIGPADATRAQLTRAATDKLRYVLEGAPSAEDGEPPKRPGIEV